MVIEEDKELNQIVLQLIAKCQAKGVVGINRVIGDYYVVFKYNKSTGDTISPVKGNQTEKIGDALSGMASEITKTFSGG